MQLDKHKEALDFALAAQCLVPSSEVAERVESIKKHLAAGCLNFCFFVVSGIWCCLVYCYLGLLYHYCHPIMLLYGCFTVEAEKSDSAKDEAARAESQRGRVISLSNLFSRPAERYAALQDSPRSEREDSDDEELELDFETSVSGDEERDEDSDVLHGSLNLRIHRKDREAACSNGSSASQSTQNEKATYKVLFLYIAVLLSIPIDDASISFSVPLKLRLFVLHHFLPMHTLAVPLLCYLIPLSPYLNSMLFSSLKQRSI